MNLAYYLVAVGLKAIALITALVATGKITNDSVLGNYEVPIALTVGICCGYAFKHFDNIIYEGGKVE